jgi:hypothetical protein
MAELIQRLATQQANPRLWVERLAIFGEAAPEHCLRSITFRRGINLVWAREPDETSRYAGIHAAGHGVGKTSLCLLLRYCLGDSSKSIDELRDEVLAEFPQGGVGAVVHAGGETYSVFRYFNAHRDGLAAQGGDIENLFGDGASQSYKEFETRLAELMLAGVAPRTIPETGQAILWRHLLAWIARDQGSRFKSFFSWREGEGTGLQRPRQDPPIVMRAVLGLLDQGESQLLTRLCTLERELDEAQENAARLRQPPSLIRKRIESELRSWLNAPAGMPLYSDDLFKESVQSEVKRTRASAASTLAQLEAEEDKTNGELVELRIDLRQKQHDYDLADNDYHLADAARRNDEAAYRKLAERREKLKALIGLCEHVPVGLQQCSHIQEEIQTVSFRDGRDLNAIGNVGADWTARAAQALQRRQQAESPLRAAKERGAAKEQALQALKIRRRTAEIEQDRGERLLAELDRWEQASGSPEAADELVTAEKRCLDIQTDIDKARVDLAKLRHEQSAREKSLAGLTDLFVQELLSHEAFGGLDIRDEERPFRLSLRGGEAYRVLEILVGDLVCLLDAGNPASAFPSLLIHDCPREADMGPRPYRDFLHLIERTEREAYDGAAPFQYIVTTTTPPPESLQQEPYLRLTLDPSQDEGLLFGRRFKSSVQTTVLTANEGEP